MPYSGVATAGTVVALPQALLQVYSMDILHQAQGIMRYRDFAVEKTELQRMPGETINFFKYDNITRGGTIAESATLTERSMSASSVPISVTEYGNAVGVTEKLLELSYDDVLAEAALLLGRDYAVVNDLMCRIAISNGAGSVIYAGNRLNRPALVGSSDPSPDYLDVETIRVAVETLQTNNVPKFNGDFYVCFIHPHQASYLRRDPDWVSAQQSAGSRALFNGELGRWEDVVFIASTHSENGACAATDPGYIAGMVNAAMGSGVADNVYRGLLMGDGAYAIATALPVEMRDNGIQDYGRKHGLAWYSIEGAGVLEASAIVAIETV